MAEPTCKLKLCKDAALAAWICLKKTQTKGEAEIRLNAGCRRAHRLYCQDTDESRTIKAGTLDLGSADRVKYLKRLLKEQMDAGIEADLAEPYEALLDAFDAAESAKK